MLTATQFLYNAAIAAGPVHTPMGKVVSYGALEPGHLAGTCYLCGADTDAGLPKKKVIKPTFTDHGLARAPDSEVVCPYCAWALSYRELRNYSILATAQGLRHPSRAEWRDILLNPPEPPFMACLAVSGQKWLHFKARINRNNEAFVVMLEEQPVAVVPKKLESLLRRIEDLYTVFSKSEIESGHYSPQRIQQFGMEAWLKHETVLERVRGSGIFDVALFVAQRANEPTTKHWTS